MTERKDEKIDVLITKNRKLLIIIKIINYPLFL